MGLSSGSARAEDARVYYKDGTTIETPDFNMKINLLIQPFFSYTDYDTGARENLGIDETDDTDSFDVRRVRLRVGGDLLQKQFSYMLWTDLRANSGSNQLQDAWLQWNYSDELHARFGQFNVPYSRQKLNADHGLQLVDRSHVSDTFSLPRQNGAMAHGNIAEGVTYALGLFNGEEGTNQGGADNKLMYTAALTASTSGYGSRAFEGDLREDNSSFEATGGVAAYYFEGNEEDVGQVDQFGLDVDLGAKAAGVSGQTEFYYRDRDFDGDVDTTDDFGFYVQGGYMLNQQWEVALRFGLVEPDADDTDQEEYSAVINYYINGHNLKVQTGVNFYRTSVGDDDTKDFQFITQLTGYI